MTELRYPFSALVWDYARGIAGFAACFVTLVTIEWQGYLVWLLAGLTVLFTIYTIQTVTKSLTRFRVSEEGIECGGFRRRAIRWAELSDLALRYYPTSRSRKKGWMTLTLKAKANSAGGKTRVEIESTLPGFSEIATRAAHAAKENKLMVDRVTADNLAAIGVAG